MEIQKTTFQEVRKNWMNLIFLSRIRSISFIPPLLWCLRKNCLSLPVLTLVYLIHETCLFQASYSFKKMIETD
jgi:hypothetical protein